MELEKLLSCWCCMLDPNQQPTRREAAAAVPTGPGAGSGQSVFDVETLDDTKDIYAVDLSERTGPEFTFLIEEASIGDEATPRPRESMWLRKNSLAVIETVRGKTGLQQLMLEFVKTAQPIAEVLVREAFLAPQERTLEPYGSGQQPLSDKRFVVDGIMFSFALARTGEKRRGTMRDETAMKAALQELRGLAHWSLASVAAASSGDAPIFFPLMAAFDLRGLRVVATSVISVESGNAPLWGSVDGGHTFAGDGPQLAAYVEKIGRLLNLKGAFVGSGAEQGPEKRLTHAPADMQIRRGLDGRFYMLGLSRLFPPESPHAPPGFDPVDSIMTRQLRPELVRQQPYPLAPDAFTAYLHPEERRRANEDVNRATERLLNQVIPELARRLDAQDVAFSAENQRLVHMLHEQGICVRHLGTLYRCAKGSLFREVVLAEMIARCIKNDMRARLREAGTSDEAALARIALAELNRCGSCDEAEWKRLREGVKRKFRLDAIPALDEYGAFVLTMKRTGYLVFRRVQALSGAVLPSSGPRAQTILADLARRLGAVPSPGPHGHSSFHPPSRPTAAQVFAAAPNGPSEILNAADVLQFTTISRAYAPPSSVLYAAPRPGDDPAVRPALPAPVLIRNGAPITGAGPSFFAPGEASPGGATPRTSNGAGQGPGQGSGPGLHPAASFSASSAGGGTWGPASGSPSQATPSGGLRATGSFGRPLGRGEVNGPKMWADLVAGKAFLTPDDVNAPLTTPGLEIACWGHFTAVIAEREPCPELWDSALHKFKASLAIRPQQTEASLLLARMLDAKGRREPPAIDIDAVREKRAAWLEDADMLFRAAESCLASDPSIRDKEAVNAVLQRAWGLSSIQYAAVLIEMERYEDALRRARSAAQKCPDSSAAWMVFAQANHKQGARNKSSTLYGAAIEAYAKAADLKDGKDATTDPQDIYFHWGSALLECACLETAGVKRKQFVALCTYAIRKLNTVLEMNPNHVLARQMLAQAKSLMAGASNGEVEEDPLAKSYGSSGSLHATPSMQSEASSYSAGATPRSGSHKEKKKDKKR